jgi:hypothetical protein
VKAKAISAIARNGKVELSREDFLILMRLAGADIVSFSMTVPAKPGPKPGTNVNKKKPGPKKKGG